jgi:hypothetical protein
VNGLKSKLSSIRKTLSTCVSDIIILTETNLSQDIDNSELGACNHNLFRSDRSDITSCKTSGGGVLIGIHKELSSTFIPCSQNDIECVFVSIHPSPLNNILIGGSYIPPGQPLNKYLSYCLAVEETFTGGDYSHVLCAGDFNQPNLDWNNYDSRVSTAIGRSLNDLATLLKLTQVNHIRNHRHVLLDLIFSTDSETSVIHEPDPIVIEDPHHPALQASLRIETIKTPKKYTYIPNFKRCDTEAVLRELQFPDINPNSLIVDVNQAMNNFSKQVQEVVLRNTPLKRVGSSVFPPWFNNDLKNMVIHKKILHTEYKKSQDPRSYHLFSLAREQCRRLADQRYNEYIQGIQDSLIHDPRVFWGFMKKSKGTSQPPPCLKYNGRTATTDEEMSDMFADFFSSVYHKSLNQQPLQCHQQSEPLQRRADCVSLLQFTEAEICRELERLDVNKGCGPDCIPPSVLKHCSTLLAAPLCSLFNSSLCRGVFPDALKASYIIPIFKSGSPTDVANYRGIAIQSTMSKVFEKLVLSKIRSFIMSSISVSQHGFTPGRSTVTNLIVFQNYITSAFKEKTQVDALYIDFSKAFDRVSHSHLLAKLEAHGIHGPLLSWFTTYLQQRPLFVRFANALSKEFTASSGVPQGSHLGPLLFILFVNDIVDVVNAECLMFADDIKLFKKISSHQDIIDLQDSFDSLQTWCLENCMSLNPDKCSCITFNRTQHPNVYIYKFGDSTPLKRVTQIKDLGVILTSSLSSEPHVVQACNKANKSLGYIFRHTRTFTRHDALRTLYCSLVRPHIEYCSVVWSPYQQYLKDMLNHIQSRFVRLVGVRMGFPYREVPVELLSQYLELPTLEARRNMQDVVFLFKLLNNFIDSPELLSLINFRASSSRTRSRDLFGHLHHGTNYEQYTAMNRIQRLGNRLPIHIDLFHSPLAAIKRSALSQI